MTVVADMAPKWDFQGSIFFTRCLLPRKVIESLQHEKKLVRKPVWSRLDLKDMGERDCDPGNRKMKICRAAT